MPHGVRAGLGDGPWCPQRLRQSLLGVCPQKGTSKVSELHLDRLRACVFSLGRSIGWGGGGAQGGPQKVPCVAFVLLPKSAVCEDTLSPGLPHHPSSLVLGFSLNPLARAPGSSSAHFWAPSSPTLSLHPLPVLSPSWEAERPRSHGPLLGHPDGFTLDSRLFCTSPVCALEMCPPSSGPCVGECKSHIHLEA